ncbi:L,D-transpeptidase [Streptomyces durbertensis]|uniref:L,D-transpeptidase n=1 Tax=Streptomyces durbertensis TaxID=2448886 RepID=A0ABR6EF63_9ACTN|nr:Ig-like domain-containing protein [Streptomyces durbertensis]MBB1243984.1 L,D-transpeptidase [Streptomyces durbertensis]
MLAVTGCGGGAGAEDKGGEKPSDKPATGASTAVVKIAPKDGAEDVPTAGGLRVAADNGRLTTVTVKDDEDREVAGRLTRGKTLWEPERPLATATRYTVNAVARDEHGREAARNATFTTLVAKDTFVGYFTPEDGSTVGVGMPVSINFNRAVANRAEVARGIEVTAEPAVEIKGHWFGDRRLDLRPEKYWKPGTKVTLDLRLNGVEAADGVYGTQEKKVSFTVGRAQVSVVDAAKKTMTVRRDGKVVKTIPVTTGAPGTETYNGKMVISERYKVTRMNGATVGFGGEYDIKDVPHAMRLSTSGTFIHGNYWASKSTFGSANVSHGCVGLHDVRGGGDPGVPGAWFYRNSMIGDVVEVRNSKDRVIQPDNGLNGWNMPWGQWGAEQ